MKSSIVLILIVYVFFKNDVFSNLFLPSQLEEQFAPEWVTTKMAHTVKINVIHLDSPGGVIFSTKVGAR